MDETDGLLDTDHNIGMLDDAAGDLRSGDEPGTDDEAPAERTYGMTATYSPEDNKLRLYTATRLDKETYERVKAEGFRWAPKQALWVAPMWTPSRADLLADLCGEIADEDTSLVDRAEERADRFQDYSHKRAADADAAHKHVESITSGIPLGQPILVGHHSEKRARKDAERIENGMRKAVQMWETSKYWVERAKGALSHAKYKERPDVRYRRIKGLEADKRKREREIGDAEKFTKMWAREGLTREQALAIANYDRVYVPGGALGQGYGDHLWSALDKDKITPEAAAQLAIASHAASIRHDQRWLDHINNRLAYERAMLGEQGGTAADKFPIEVGGRVLAKHWRARGKGWLVVTKINRSNGSISSVSTTEGVVEIESVTEYKAPEAGDVAKVKAASKLPPLVNYPGEGFRHMLKAEYESRSKHSDFWRARKVKATEKWGAHRRREAPEKDGGQYWKTVGVYLTDAKRVDPPPPATTEPVTFEHEPAPLPPPSLRPLLKAERTAFDDMKDSLKAGVVVVSAPQLFPTPPDLAARMVRQAHLEPGLCVLEPSAGTGNIVRAVLDTVDTEVLAYEIDQNLCSHLTRTFPDHKLQVRCRDFLTVTDFHGCYPRILMNPPFAAGQDVAHVEHAWSMLAEGGVLVSVMSAGVTFRSDKRTVAFRALVETHGEIEELPDDTFKDSGTGVRTVLVTLRK